MERVLRRARDRRERLVRYTATADSTLLVDTSESTYTAGVAIVTGAPGSFTTLTCGPTAVIFSIAAGKTVWIVVFDDQLDEGGNGGTLQLTVMEAPPAPTVDVTVDPIAHFDPQTGTVTVSGTVTCTGAETVDDFIDAQVRQQVGRFFITGFGGTTFTCDGTSQPWTVEVASENGLFKGGKATSLTFAFSATSSSVAVTSRR